MDVVGDIWVMIVRDAGAARSYQLLLLLIVLERRRLRLSRRGHG